MEKIGSDSAILQKSILQNLSDESLSEKGMKVFGSIRLIECHYYKKNMGNIYEQVYWYNTKNKI